MATIKLSDGKKYKVDATVADMFDVISSRELGAVSNFLLITTKENREVIINISLIDIIE